MQHKALHLFWRDLRLQDNTALLAALEESERVIPAFIFDPRQCDPSRNKFFNPRLLAFRLQSLEALDRALQRRGSQLYVFHGFVEDVLEELIRRDAVDAVYLNRDYGPTALKRDQRLRQTCSRHSIPLHVHRDSTLSPVEDIASTTGDPYTVFTPFYKRAQSYEVPSPRKNTYGTYVTGRLATRRDVLGRFAERATTSHIAGGRPSGLRMLRNMSFLVDYSDMRDIPALAGTSQLSAHHTLGTISIRETYHAAKRQGSHGLVQFITELYWRDFYYHVAHFHPYIFKKPLAPWGDALPWRDDKADYRAWRKGETGIPIVDAGMRQLNGTGWMHNRVRMIVASFLTKNLLIDWRKGERYFSRHLADYDPVVNTCSWQWCAQVGTDPRPLRIFNPYTQAAKHDPDAEYIKHFVPELRDVDSALLSDGKERDYHCLVPRYPEPLVSTRFSYHRAREVYAKAKRDSRGVGT